MADRLCEHVLLGTAVGDAFGLSAEGLPRRVTEKRTEWTPRLAILSDDTEQSFLVAQSLLRANGDVDQFRKTLKRRLILWLLAGPPGVGFGTARSIVKLMFGGRVGVWSAGNGAAMRSAIIGATYASDVTKVEAFVRASTTLTHADPRAFVGAFAVALAAGASERDETWRSVFQRIAMAVESAPAIDEWKHHAEEFAKAMEAGDGVAEFATRIGCEQGVSGYVYHTVPVALYAWARYDDPAVGLTEVWRCGGDTDSVGAIAGALLYARAWQNPADTWLSRVRDYPVNVSVLRSAGANLDNRTSQAVKWSWFLLPLRNILLLPAILFYAILVLLPRKYFG